MTIYQPAGHRNRRRHRRGRDLGELRVDDAQPGSLRLYVRLGNEHLWRIARLGHLPGTYAYLHQLTGRTIFVDTSFSASAMGDTWSNSPAATINARIADGVIAANVTAVPSNYSSAISTLAPSLTKVCSN